MALWILLSALLQTGCAAAIPSTSSGESFLTAREDLPRQVMISPGDWVFEDSIGNVLRSELPALGFSLVEKDPDAIFVGAIVTSDFSPIQLQLRLERVTTREVLWSAMIHRDYDLYSSVISASTANAREAMKLLGKDLLKSGRRR